ncbi:MAG: BTAD domain-containing putative transcriptional regulator [Vulcanimicrobiaceae bacterium]
MFAAVVHKAILAFRNAGERARASLSKGAVVLEIRLLGPPEFVYAGAPFRFSAPPRTLPLLAWLLMHRRAPLQRDAIAFAFWPDASEDDARGDLRRHLYYLAKALPPPGGEPWLLADKKTVVWNERASVVFDVADFERQAADDAALDAAVRLYRGPLLAGSSDEWIDPERERLQLLAEGALLRLVERTRDREPARAIGYAQALLRLDPWREDALRALIEARHRTGDRSGALREYRAFADRLRAELQVAPMPETTAVYDAIAGTTAPLPVAASAPARAATNLPAPAGALIGRDRELVEIGALLAAARVATLAGTGGVGKTRLAIEAGHRALATFSGGVRFVDFGPIADPQLVLTALGAGLGIAQATERPTLAALAAWARERQALVILDNCEHVVREVARVVDELVGLAPELRVLATSREPLAVRGERVYRVPSLDVPEDFDPLSPARARTYGAVALFEARARAAKNDFSLDDHNVGVVVEICRRLDGIALALELAAARVVVFSPHELARRLDERFRLLAGGERSALPRQRTMRALIDWSWDLCPQAERTALQRFGIFANGFTFEAAERICFAPPLSREGAIDVLAALVEKSLLVATSDGETTRYRLLESIHAYALEKLAGAGERTALGLRHAEYFTTFASAVDAAYETVPDDVWFARATGELDNVRAAIAFAADDDPARAAELASAYATVWEYGSGRADRSWLDRAYAGLDRAANEALATRLTYQIAAISYADGRHADWVGAAVRDRGDARTRADASLWLAERYADGGDVARAEAAFAEVARADDLLRRPKTHARALVVRAKLAARRRADAEATELFERAIAAGNACGALAVVASARVAYAELVFAAGDVARARVVAEEARAAIGRHFGRTGAYADVSANLAGYAIAADDFEDAARRSRDALAVARTLDFPQRLVVALEHLAVVIGLAGDDETAATILGFTEAERVRRDFPRGTTERGGAERLFARLRGVFDEDALAQRLARGAIAGSERIVARALA